MLPAPVGKQHDRPTPLQVANDRAVTVIAPPCEVVNADHAQRLARHPGTLPDHAQQRIIADRQHYPGGKTRSGPAAQHEPQMLDDMIETIGPARSRRKDPVTKALREDLTAAQDRIAAKSPDEDLELDASAAERQVLCSPEIPALDPLREHPAVRTWTGAGGGPGSDNNTIAFDRDTVDHQTCGNQAGWSKSLLHRADSFWKPASEQPLPAADLSQTQYWTPIEGQLCRPFDILVLELLQPAHLSRQKPLVLLLPIEIGRLADPGPPADLRHRNPVHTLLQDERLLRVRKLRVLHRFPLLPAQGNRHGKL
ncbi:hypothetical protein GGC47_004946 [Bosea sp. OAE752]